MPVSSGPLRGDDYHCSQPEPNFPLAWFPSLRFGAIYSVTNAPANHDMISDLVTLRTIILKYISIDGDDIGRKITSCYLSNDVGKLKLISRQIEESTLKIAALLESKGFDVIFRAADGVVARTNTDCNFEELFFVISSCPTNEITFSAGVGSSLREAYVALINSKSNGKNQISNFSALK
ncbi:mCpol domain-containing protein [Pseudomonas chlororaphis]